MTLGLSELELRIFEIYIIHWLHTHEAEWTPFEMHYFSENLVATEIEPEPLDL
jgi:hypothetical protein